MPTHLLHSLTRQATKSPSLRTITASRPSLFSAPRWLSSEPITESTEPAEPTGTTSTEITTGTIQYFDNSNSYGFIKPSNNSQQKVDKKDLIFIHESQILKHSVDNTSFTIRPRKGTSVQFNLHTTHDGKKQAYNLTQVGGSYIPPFQNDYLNRYERNRKAQFGAEVFGIMDSVTEQTDMEHKIVQAFEGVKKDIGRQREKMEKVLSVYNGSSGGGEGDGGETQD